MGRTRSFETNNGLSRRDFLRLAGTATVGLAAGLSLSACSAFQPSAGRRPQGKVQLVYQDWRTDWFPPMAQQMLDEFQATHPNIRVFYVPDAENLEEQMLKDMQNGTAPDVFQGCCTHFPIWAQRGFALDLRPFIQADLDKAIISDWDPVQYKALATRDGRQFGLPKYHGALALYYNKDLFDEFRVPYPDASWTYEDYQRAMRLTSGPRSDNSRTQVWGSYMQPAWDRLQVYVNAWGGHMVDPNDPQRCTLAEPAALRALEWLRARMWEDKTMATPLDVQNRSVAQAFIAGKVAMIEDGSWSLKPILEGATFRVGVAPFPAGPVRRATLATTDGFGIYAGTRHPEESWELVKFLIGKEYGLAMARTNLLQPARASLVDEWVSLVCQQYPDKARDMDIAAFADGHRNGYSVVTEIHSNMELAGRVTNAAWERIFAMGLDPVDEAMKSVCRDLQQTGSPAGGR
jgi:ABC-type glycerol-3-phosphate transport system substrate-binding protein